MSTISINLLPAQFKVAQNRPDKFKIIQTVGYLFLLVLIFFSSVTVALRIFQSQEISKLESEINLSETQVLQLKSKETALAILKNRTTIISEIIESHSDQSDLYKKVNSLIPAAVLVSAFSLDSEGNVSLSAAIPDRASLTLLLNNLTPSSQGFKKVEIENLSRSKDGTYRANVVIKTK